MEHLQYFDFDKVLEQSVYFVCETVLSFFLIKHLFVEIIIRI